MMVYPLHSQALYPLIFDNPQIRKYITASNKALAWDRPLRLQKDNV